MDFEHSLRIVQMFEFSIVGKYVVSNIEKIFLIISEFVQTLW